MNLPRAITDFQAILRGASEASSVEVCACVMLLSGTTWTVQVRGGVVPAFWGGGVIPRPGAAGVCLLMKYPNASAVAWVLDTVGATPASGEVGTVGTVSANTALITIRGVQYTGRRISTYVPTLGDNAVVMWAAGVPYLIAGTAVVSDTTMLTPVVPPSPPSPVTTSKSLFTPSDSGTWMTGTGWNASWGNNVFQNATGGFDGASSGNFFYAGRTKGLADKTTINRVRIWLGAMLEAGTGINASVAVNFYTHTSDTRGTTEPSRGTGPFTVTVPALWPGGYLDLPVGVGTTMKTGGGISIYGDPFAGFSAGALDPNAGALLFDWSK